MANVTTTVATVTSRATSTRATFDALSFRALNVGRALAALSPLVKRTRLHSFNARIAALQLGGEGAAFGIVARSLAEVGDELAALAVDVEECRAAVIGALARCARSETWLALYGRSVGASGAADPCAEPLISSTGTAWTAQRDATDAALEASLWAGMLSYRADMLRDIARLRAQSNRLLRLTDDVERVAERQGFFIGSNALVEASRLGEGSQGVTALAVDLRDLTLDIRSGVQIANGEARSLVDLAGALVQGEVAAAIRELDKEDD
jgi:hypothetical protein